MKRFIIILWGIMIISTTLFAQIRGTVKWTENEDFYIEVKDGYIDVFPNQGTSMNKIGAPKLPYCVKTFLIPINAQPLIQVQKSNRHLLRKDVLVYPTQKPIPVSDDIPEWVNPDSVIYNSNSPYPGKYAEIISDREDFGYHLITIKFSPLEYIPKMKELYLYDVAFTLTYTTTFSGASTFKTERQSSYLNELDKQYIRSIIENKEMLDEITPNIKSIVNTLQDQVNLKERAISIVSEQVPEYLIITNDALKGTFQKLADWKKKKGIPTIIETVENINVKYPGSDLQEKIRNYLIYVRRSYGSLFVLLGGDTNIIPARLKKSRSSTNKDPIAVDFYYTCVERGNWNGNGNNVFYEGSDFDNLRDWGLSFKLGRAPVENQIEAEVFVDKVIHYEKADLGIDYSYIKNSMVADAFIGKNDDTGSLSSSARNAIMEYYSKVGLNRWLIYDHYNCTSRTSFCDGKHSSDICIDNTNRGEELNKVNFVAALRNGGNSSLNHFHLVYHMDHSSPTRMGTSSKDKNEFISNWDVDNLDNGNYSQIIVSGGCSPADINRDCIVEHFINNPNGGAVAFLGNTDTGYAVEYQRLETILNELFVSNGAFRFDLSYIHQKSTPYSVGTSTYPLSSSECAFHLFGDPEMQIWTDTPKALGATVTPTALSTGSRTITVNISGLPLNTTARVCIQKGDELYIVQQLANGSHTIPLLVQTSGVVNVTMTAHNFRPLEKIIQVSSVGSEPTLAVSDMLYDDDKNGASIGNANGMLEAGETIELKVKLKNTGTVAQSGVTAVLTSLSDDIEIVTEQASFGMISGNSAVVSSSPFVFRINCNSSEHLKNSESVAKLKLQITAGGTTKTEFLKLEDIYAPEIQIGNQTITWTTNGDTNISSGESVKMNIDLTNVGRSVATGLKATLLSNNAQVLCPITLITYPDIPASETKANTTAFTFSASANYTGLLNLTLKVTNAYGKTWSFPVNPLSRPATIGTSTMSFKPYESSINVNWTPIKSVAGYNLYRSDNGSSGTYRKLNKLPLTAAYYLDENLSGRTLYHYKVAAVSTNGNESMLSAAYQTWTSYPVVSPFPLRITTGDYRSASSPCIADVDNDGKQEIFWLNGNGETKVSYLMGFRSTGEELFDIDNNVTTVSGFAQMPTLSKNLIAIGDLKGTGEQNLVVSTWNNDEQPKNAVCCYSPFDKDGDKRPDLLWKTMIPYSFYPNPVVANLDGSPDGTMEVVVKSHQTQDIYILDCNGKELRRLNPNSGSFDSSNYSGVTVADLDDDGQMEVLATYNNLGLYIWRHTGEPFTTNPFWGANIGKLSSAPVICDLNEDGKKEILFSQIETANSRIFAIGLGGNKIVSGWSTQTIPYSTGGGSLDHTLSVGDINNDGHLEVVALGKEMVKARKHTGEEIFAKKINGLFPSGQYDGNINTPILADVDGDGVPDIVFCCGHNIYALRNNGSEIVGFPIISDEDFVDTPCVADIDNDGKNELIASNVNDLYVWKTDGKPGAIEWRLKRGNAQHTGEYFSGICEPMVINGNKIWDGKAPCSNVVIQSGKFIIPAGKTMTLNGASILIVRSGATLEIDGGTIQEATIKALKGSTVIIKNNGCIKLKKLGGLQMEKGAQLDYQYGRIDVAD